MEKTKQKFGGKWTLEKLERIEKYLNAYMQIMKTRRFKVAYIDAFAGTGYIRLKQKDSNQGTLLPELAEMREFIDGSARVALRVEPRFHKYIFIERRKSGVAELQKLKEEFPLSADDILIECADANDHLLELCGKNWSNRRAVMFLDPYGMQVEWRTIEAIANTKAIDLWILFPLGVAVNRLIKKDGKISTPIKHRLDQLFGTTDWFDEFYRKTELRSLFDEEPMIGVEKAANFESIGRYFNERLSGIFAGVADNPLPLYNSANNPLYLLCFAAANEKGAPTAVKIAQHILRRK